MQGFIIYCVLAIGEGAEESRKVWKGDQHLGTECHLLFFIGWSSECWPLRLSLLLQTSVPSGCQEAILLLLLALCSCWGRDQYHPVLSPPDAIFPSQGLVSLVCAYLCTRWDIVVPLYFLDIYLENNTLANTHPVLEYFVKEPTLGGKNRHMEIYYLYNKGMSPMQESLT